MWQFPAIKQGNHDAALKDESIITETSYLVRLRLKSPALRLFIQPFIHAQIKENIKTPRHWLCEGNPPVTGDFFHKGTVTRKMSPFDDVIMDLTGQIRPKHQGYHFAVDVLK